MIRAFHPVHVAPRFLLDPFEPAYLALYRDGELRRRVAAGLRELEDCCACPRNCHVNRMENQTRVCHTGRYARVASSFAHFGEEDCLRGRNGSGTIFFSLCNLRCVFCQNWDISQQTVGSECPPEKLAELMLDLQRRVVTTSTSSRPSMSCPRFSKRSPRRSLADCTCRSFTTRAPTTRSIPCDCSTGSSTSSCPTSSSGRRETARRLAKAKDYPDRAREAILEMHRQVGVLKYGPDGLAKRGVLVRRLVMPGQSAETEADLPLAGRGSLSRHVHQHHGAVPAGVRSGADCPGWSRSQVRRDRQAAGKRRDPRAYEAARHVGLWRLDQRWADDTGWVDSQSLVVS